MLAFFLGCNLGCDVSPTSFPIHHQIAFILDSEFFKIGICSVFSLNMFGFYSFWKTGLDQCVVPTPPPICVCVCLRLSWATYEIQFKKINKT